MMGKGMADEQDTKELIAKAEKKFRRDGREAARERRLQDALEDDEVREALKRRHAQPKEQAGLD